MKPFIQHHILASAFCFLAGCTSLSSPGIATSSSPPPIWGDFQDDYGIQYTISELEWNQLPDSTYQVVLWDHDHQYLIARNGPNNLSNPNLWTRIDWMTLPGMPPYEWAFCISAYAALSAAEAKSSVIAHRESPKTGCNGHPFSRMQRTRAVEL